MLKPGKNGLSVSFYAAAGTLTVLWTLKSDREAISLSSSSVADVAEGLAELEYKNHFFNCFNKPTKYTISTIY